MRRVALFTLLILAACAGDGETAATTTVAPPVLTSIGDAAPVTSSTSTTTLATTTTVATTTTTIEPPNAAAQFGLTQVVFGEASLVVITNWGNTSGNLEGYWLSQGDLHKSLPNVELAPGEQALLGLSRIPPPELAGMAAVLFLGPTIGVLDPDSGEVALHADSAFDNPASMVSYVEWGEPGHDRSATAIAAGVWSEGSVAVFDDAPSISSGVFPAASQDSWFADVGG